MKTFEVTVENLGPVKSASFVSSHFNVLCGKNNSGKSICMHTAFCFFSEWRDQLHLQAADELAGSLVTNGRVDFLVDDYLQKVNPEIARTMPSFARKIPLFLHKTDWREIEQTKVSISVDDGYLRMIAKKTGVNVRLAMLPSYWLRMRKDENSETVEIWIDNRGGENFPPEGLIKQSLNRLLDFLFFERMLPRPYLLTAERSGSILYGDDLRSLSFADAQKVRGNSTPQSEDDRSHYAVAYVRELKNIWSMGQGVVGTADDHRDGQEAIRETVRKRFRSSIAGGSYTSKSGIVYYHDDSGGDFRIGEASTSAKAMAQLSFFIDRLFDGNLLLMIDEPELNLHPERQRALVRLLALMQRTCGVGVMVSTHSDCVIRELNTLLALGSDVNKYKDVMSSHGYREDELLRSDDFACGVVEDGTIHQLEICGAGGFAIRSFDSTFDEINAVQDAIVAKWELVANRNRKRQD